VKIDIFNFKVSSLLYVILSSVAALSINISHSNYEPSIEASFKLGSARDVGRVSLLLPLLQAKGRLAYFNLIGMMDNKNGQEGNYAVGYRQKFGNNILGGYVYYDRRNSRLNHLMHQSTIGIEWLRECTELRINGYIPISKSKILSTKTAIKPRLIGTKAYLATVAIQQLEVPLSGIDIEFGLTPTNFPVNLYAAYYYFNAKNAPIVQGPRGRVQIKLLRWLNISGEIQKDKPRGLTWFGGVEVRVNIGSSMTAQSQSILDRKMTQMPIRDIDVVVERSTKEFVIKQSEVTVISDREGLEDIRNNPNGIYLVREDIDCEGKEFEPIAGEMLEKKILEKEKKEEEAGEEEEEEEDGESEDEDSTSRISKFTGVLLGVRIEGGYIKKEVRKNKEC